MSEGKTISRRQFLKRAGGFLLASTLACSGVTYVGTRRPAVDLIEESYEGEIKMEKKVLVAYASRAGSTAEVAAKIGETLSQNGLSVEVRPVKEVKDLSPYGAVILGSAIRVGNLLKEANSFVEANADTLRSMPTAVFVVCMTLETDTPENRKTVDAYMDPVRELIQPNATAAFAGVMDLKKLSFLERTMIKAMKAPLGDFRDWAEIGTWAKDMQNLVMA